MTIVTMLEFRKAAARYLKRAQMGERMVLTYRGKPVVRLEPAADGARPSTDDALYRMADLAAEGGSLSNEEMDRLIYGA